MRFIVAITIALVIGIVFDLFFNSLLGGLNFFAVVAFALSTLVGMLLGESTMRQEGR